MLGICWIEVRSLARASCHGQHGNVGCEHRLDEQRKFVFAVVAETLGKINRERDAVMNRYGRSFQRRSSTYQAAG